MPNDPVPPASLSASDLFNAQKIGELIGMVGGLEKTMQAVQQTIREDRDNMRSEVSKLQAGQEKNRDGFMKLLEGIYVEIKSGNESRSKQDQTLVMLKEFKRHAEGLFKVQVDTNKEFAHAIDVLEKARSWQLGWAACAGLVAGTVGTLLMTFLPKFFH